MLNKKKAESISIIKIYCHSNARWNFQEFLRSQLFHLPTTILAFDHFTYFWTPLRIALFVDKIVYGITFLYIIYNFSDFVYFFLRCNGGVFQVVMGYFEKSFIFFLIVVWWFRNKPATLHSQTAKEGSGKGWELGFMCKRFYGLRH